MGEHGLKLFVLAAETGIPNRDASAAMPRALRVAGSLVTITSMPSKPASAASRNAASSRRGSALVVPMPMRVTRSA